MDRGAARYRAHVVIICSVVSLILGGVIGYFTRQPRQGTPIRISTPLPTLTPSPTSAPAPIRVYVSGAVRQPAVYRLPPGSIVQDALDAAGGPAADADLDRINLALELLDQQQVYVARQGETNPAPSVSGGESEGELVNINTAPVTELETLPGIGPVTAQSILEYREANGPFERIEDIQDVPGIGPATLEGIRDLIRVE